MCHLRADQSDVRGSKTQCDRDDGAIIMYSFISDETNNCDATPPEELQ